MKQLSCAKQQELQRSSHPSGSRSPGQARQRAGLRLSSEKKKKKKEQGENKKTGSQIFLLIPPTQPH